MDKYVVIGGTSGIGLALVNRLLEKDAEVHALSRKEDDLASTDAHFHECDVMNEETEFPSIEDAINGFVYCPGTITLKPFDRMSVADFQHDLDINFLGAVKAVHHYLPQLKKADHGSIVLLSTVAVGVGMPFHTSIAAAKAAVEGFARSLAAELAPSIRVNVVAPSLTDTQLAESLLGSDAKREGAAKRHPLHRVGEPDDIAATIEFLLSKDASWITGQVIGVDGGLSTLKLL